MDNSFTVEHYKHGIGVAILIKNRKQQSDDLFMCSFKNAKGRHFFCRKHIDEGEDIWWSDGKPKKITRRKVDKSSLDNALGGIFGSGGGINF